MASIRIEGHVSIAVPGASWAASPAGLESESGPGHPLAGAGIGFHIETGFVGTMLASADDSAGRRDRPGNAGDGA
jgi:hypothetical protein